MKLFFSLIIILLFASTASAEFWASKIRNKYHYPTCEWAQQIEKKNIIKYKTYQEVNRDGRKPCRLCMPPSAGRLK